MRAAIGIFILVLSAVTLKAQQDPQYNLYQFNQMVINPAYAGARDAISGVASVRNQWSGFSDLRTTCLSVHSPVASNKVGVGLTIVNDKMGPRTFTGFNLNGAYIAKLNNKYKLSFGLSAGYSTYRFNYSKIEFNSAEIPTALMQDQKHGVLDINTGLFLRANSFFAGLSITHLNGPSIYEYGAVTPLTNNYSYKLAGHLFLTMGKSWILNKNVIFAPTLMLKTVKGSGQLDLNFNFFLHRKLWLGAFIRAGYGPGFLLQYYISNQFKVGYSYDTGIRDARRLGGSHELMIGFDLAAPKSRIVNPRFL